jgi:ribosomal protein S19
MLHSALCRARSAWKGPYFVTFPGMSEARAANAPIQTDARASTIIPEHVGSVRPPSAHQTALIVGARLKFLVHNGKRYVPLSIIPEMVGHKLGEFAPTKVPYLSLRSLFRV